jgi:hypothetical protein
VSAVIQIKSKEVLLLSQVFRLALKYIFDKWHFTAQEGRQLEDSILNWANAIQFKKDMGSSMYENEEYQLGIIAKLLKQNEEGKLERRKALFKEHKISYKKYYRLREAYRPEDFLEARREYETLCRLKPEENL